MAAKFKIGDMVRGNKDSQFLNEKIEGIVVGITHSSSGNLYFANYLYLIQDKDGAHYNYVDGRWLEASDASQFRPKELREGSIVMLSPHSKKKGMELDREEHYLVEKVEENIATIILQNECTRKIHVEDLQIVR